MDRTWYPLSQFLPQQNGRYAIKGDDGRESDGYFIGTGWIADRGFSGPIIAWSPPAHNEGQTP